MDGARKGGPLKFKNRKAIDTGRYQNDNREQPFAQSTRNLGPVEQGIAREVAKHVSKFDAIPHALSIDNGGEFKMNSYQLLKTSGQPVRANGLSGHISNDSGTLSSFTGGKMRRRGDPESGRGASRSSSGGGLRQQKYDARESNPWHSLGKRICYHYTSVVAWITPLLT